MKNILMKYHFSMTLLVMALIIYVYALLGYYRHNWNPVSIPIMSLESPVFADFKADQTDKYRVYIQFQNNKNDLYWKCLYGTANYDSNCSNITESVAVQWKVLSQASLVDQGTATGPYRKVWEGGGGANPEGSNVIFMPAEMGKTYQIEVSVKGPSSTIKETKPYLKVEAPQGLHKDAYVTRILLSNVALLIFVLALFAAIIEFYLQKKKNGSSETTTDL